MLENTLFFLSLIWISMWFVHLQNERGGWLARSKRGIGRTLAWIGCGAACAAGAWLRTMQTVQVRTHSVGGLCVVCVCPVPVESWYRLYRDFTQSWYRLCVPDWTPLKRFPRFLHFVTHRVASGCEQYAVQHCATCRAFGFGGVRGGRSAACPKRMPMGREDEKNCGGLKNKCIFVEPNPTADLV